MRVDAEGNCDESSLKCVNVGIAVATIGADRHGRPQFTRRASWDGVTSRCSSRFSSGASVLDSVTFSPSPISAVTISAGVIIKHNAKAFSDTRMRSAIRRRSDVWDRRECIESIIRSSMFVDAMDRQVITAFWKFEPPDYIARVVLRQILIGIIDRFPLGTREFPRKIPNRFKHPRSDRTPEQGRRHNSNESNRCGMIGSSSQ